MALFRFYLLLFFSGVKAVYFHFSFQFLCKEMVLVRKSCPDQKLVYTFSDPKFPVKPQLSKGPTTFNSKDSSVLLYFIIGNGYSRTKPHHKAIAAPMAAPKGYSRTKLN